MGGLIIWVKFSKSRIDPKAPQQALKLSLFWPFRVLGFFCARDALLSVFCSPISSICAIRNFWSGFLLGGYCSEEFLLGVYRGKIKRWQGKKIKGIKIKNKYVGKGKICSDNVFIQQSSKTITTCNHILSSLPF